MEMESDNNSRIAKNTIILYLRMIFILCVGLFTSRIILNTLGVEDYGIYNVVGGFVTIFAFLNGSMSTATQRFITFELARGELNRQRATFSTAIIIHLSLAAIIFILAETIGLWFVYNELVIPENRFYAAVWVYQFSIASCCLSVISLPYNAMIIAHERMSAFAYISIFDAILKLLIVYSLLIVPWDKLIVYSALLFTVQLLDRIIYGIYCRRHFAEAQFNWTFNKSIFKEMGNIAGWSIFGNLAGVCYTQGLNILLNMFFGPAVNAARGVAVTVQGVVLGFVNNFQMALNPQITKAYAVNNFHRMYALIYASSKISFFLLFLIALPIIVEAHTILTIWLKIVPEHTVWFLRLTLCIMLIETLANPLMISSQASGRVRVYQSVVGGLLLLILPIAYIVLKCGANPESVFVVHLVIAGVAQCARLFIVGRIINMSLRAYFRNVVWRIGLVCSMSVTFSFYLTNLFPNTTMCSMLVMTVIFIVNLGIIMTCGLTKNERGILVDKIMNLIPKCSRHV